MMLDLVRVLLLSFHQLAEIRIMEVGPELQHQREVVRRTWLEHLIIVMFRLVEVDRIQTQLNPAGSFRHE